jgi:hypothetical protein
MIPARWNDGFVNQNALSETANREREIELVLGWLTHLFNAPPLDSLSPSPAEMAGHVRCRLPVGPITDEHQER